MNRYRLGRTDSQLSVLMTLILLVILLHESLALRFAPGLSFFRLLHLGSPTDHSRTLGLGWGGFGIMVIMNLYSLRKRFGFFETYGPPLPLWLNFHIFCGLTGPLIIVFHTGFKMHGIASVSFWAMVISVLSGVLGHYLYREVKSQTRELRLQTTLNLQRVKRELQENPDTADQEQIQEITDNAVRLAGVTSEAKSTSPWQAVFRSLMGDFRLRFLRFSGGHRLSKEGRRALRQYALGQRRKRYYELFQKTVSHWHAFHLPFALFTYLTAVVHIISALLFSVGQ